MWKRSGFRSEWSKRGTLKPMLSKNIDWFWTRKWTEIVLLMSSVCSCVHLLPSLNFVLFFCRDHYSHWGALSGSLDMMFCGSRFSGCSSRGQSCVFTSLIVIWFDSLLLYAPVEALLLLAPRPPPILLSWPGGASGTLSRAASCCPTEDHEIGMINNYNYW